MFLLFKSQIVFLAAITLFSGCPSPKQHVEVDKIVLSITGRRYTEDLRIERIKKTQQFRIYYKKNGAVLINKSVSNKDLRKLQMILVDLDLTTVPLLNVPSKKHQYDGAMLTVLTLIHKGVVYKSPTFDDDNPPKEIKLLLEKLRKLVA